MQMPPSTSLTVHTRQRQDATSFGRYRNALIELKKHQTRDSVSSCSNRSTPENVVISWLLDNSMSYAWTRKPARRHARLTET